MFIRIYKLADLYDLVDNKLKEIDKEIKEKLTDDLEMWTTHRLKLILINFWSGCFLPFIVVN